MKRNEIVRLVRNELGISHAQATRAVEGIFDEIKASLAKGEDVTILNFGRFYVGTNGASRRPNPATGELVDFPATRSVRFQPSRALRANLKGAKK